MNARRILEDRLPTGGDNAPDDAPDVAGVEPPAGGTQQVKLGDILAVLPEEVQTQVLELLRSQSDDLQLASKAKALLVPHRAALEGAGIIPEYLAYMLVYVRQQVR